MSDRDSEIERIRRIRDRQLSARDPGKRERKFQQKISGRHRKQLTFGEALRDLSGKVWGMIIGAIIGLVFAVVLNLAIETETSWVQWVGYITVFAGVAIGRVLGAALDWRDEDHDALVGRR